jgi:agmatinase
MSALPYRSAERAFLGLEGRDRPPEAAKAVVIPFGLEATVSFAHGTAKGPEAIIAASPELEFFDEELGREPYRDFGIATLEAPSIPQDVPAALSALEKIVKAVLAEGKFPLTLGGEHTLTVGAIGPQLRRYPDLVVLQLDAHADLRDGYLGEPYSHAAAMRRVLDLGVSRLVSVGIRNIAAEETAFLKANSDRVSVHWARERARWRLDEVVAPLAGRPVYVTFDVDAFDAGLMPATGTPEPGGLSWDEALGVLQAAAKVSPIVGADVVELAPIPGLHACDFTVAKLAYKLLTYALSARG